MTDKDTRLAELDEWLIELVTSKEYKEKLKQTVMVDVENPNQRATLMLDLMDRVKPKIKPIDPVEPDKDREISVTYVEDPAKKKRE